MKFTNKFGTVEFVDGELIGDPTLVRHVQLVIEMGSPCGCDFWSSIEPSLDTEWEAYLSICGAIRQVTGIEPQVVGVPDNPDGYEPEGVWPQRGFDGKRSSTVASLVAACLAEACAPPPVGTGGSLPEGAARSTSAPSPSKVSARAFGNMLKREGFPVESVTKATSRSWRVRTTDGKVHSISTGTDVSTKIKPTGERKDRLAGTREAKPEDYKRLKVSPKVRVVVYPEGQGGHVVGFRHNAKTDKWIPIYSAEHQKGQAAAKYARTKQLVERIGKLDERLSADMMTDDDAAAVLLMRRLGLRPGGGASRTYGATTLEARHVRLLDDGRVEFNFLGKAGMRYKRIVDDPDIRRVVEKRLKGKSPNDRLFSTDEKRANDYLDRAFGSNEFNVKDLRTLHANVLALRKIKSMRPPKNKKEYKAAVAAVVKHVAQALNNKPAVAKKDYIDPTVFAEWEEVNV